MKRSLLLIFGILIILFINACSDNNISEPSPESQLNGKWISKYENGNFDITFPEGNPPEDTLTSLLNLEKGEFSLEIRTQGNYLEKQYNGTYAVNRNSIIFNASGNNSFTEEFIYSIKNSTIKFASIPRVNEKDSLAIRMGSFLWNYSTLAGTFYKSE